MRRHPRDGPPEDVGEDASVGVGVVECGLNHASLRLCIVKNNRISTDMWARAFIIPSIYCMIQTYTEPVPLKYGKLATKYPWIYGYFYSVHVCVSSF